MNELLNKYDHLLSERGAAAIISREWLKPVGDEVVFPPTYAGQNGGDSDYTIDRIGDKLICTIDSIPSQANRLEPFFIHSDKNKKEDRLVPQVTVSVPATDEVVHLLKAGHRAADAIVRFSSLKTEIDQAITRLNKGDATALAKLAPTTILFGMWDSRGSGVKVSRLINSIIRAYDVERVSRSAQYFPATGYAEAGVVAEEGEGNLRKLADEGMAEVPSVGKPGGVMVRGDIRREVALNLCTLRDVQGGDNPHKLQRYLLGLALVAMTCCDGKAFNLRQGCQLVLDCNKKAWRKLILPNGLEEDFSITFDEAMAYAKAVSADFGVGEDKSGVFDPAKAKDALKPKEGKKGKKSSAKEAKAEQNAGTQEGA